MRKKTILMTLMLLFAVAQRALAFEGSGTQDDPFLIQTNADWQQFARDVRWGYSYAGKYFKMTADIDAEENTAGDNLNAFSGTFDGNGHTLTYSRGEGNGQIQTVDDYCAPFVLLNGATIRHLWVTGEIYSSHKFAAGIASMIEGSQTTTIDDCHVSSKLWADLSLTSDATFGGLIGVVNEHCTQSPVIKNSTFTGTITASATCSAGLVGYTFSIPVIFEHCMFDPKEIPYADGCATFVRTASGVECSFKECYYTMAMGTQQGEAVFNEILVPDNCKAEIVSEATLKFDGTDYWQSGAVVHLTAPDDVAFDHWISNSGCWVSDPWQRSGLQTVRDIHQAPSISITTSMPAAKKMREIDGTKYRFLYKQDYHLYLSDELCQEKRYYFDDNGELFHWSEDGDHIWVTAVVGWVPGEIPSDGAQIHNDLSGWLKDYTLTACIAPRAFKGCTELKTLYFKDTDANNYNAQVPFDFIIGDSAFADCPNLTEVKMIQYTTEGDNHWEALKSTQVSSVGSTVFDGSPQACFSVDASQYQGYMNSEVWKSVNRRLIIYGHTHVDMTVNGAKYTYMSNTAGEALKNNADGHASLMETLRYWNTNFKNFNAADCLAEQDNKNIWYTEVVGADDSYLKSNDGVMRIYNDPGSYYNYKTLDIKRNAFKDCEELKKIEFWQTNGRSENSYSDLKLVIQNNALQGCSNLKELRMFYYAQDGGDRWVTLGPDDVIPGDNIFGTPTAAEYEAMSETERENSYRIPNDFRILVATDRYDEFLEDPNWMPYIPYIEPVEFDPTGENTDFTLDGLTYGYLTSMGGIRQTSQTVSQDLSWWTAARLAWEVFSWTTTIKGWISAAEEAAQSAMAEYTLAETMKNVSTNMFTTTTIALGQTGQAAQAQALRAMLTTLGEQGATFSSAGLVLEGNREFFTRLVSAGIINSGAFTGTTNLADEALVNLGMTLKEHLFESMLTHATNSATQRALANKLWWSSMKWSLIKKPIFYTASSVLSKTAMGTWAKFKETTNGQANVSDAMLKGMRNNILANIHQWGSVANGMLYTTPTKNLVYHTYLKSVPADKSDVRINVAASKNQGRNAFAVTMNMSQTAFQGNTSVQKVSFYDNEEVSSNEGVGMYFTIPDSAFVGCTNLKELRLILDTKENGSYALGPENFILGGDNIFAGVDSTQFHIVIDPSRKQDFLDNESWAPLEPFFAYENAKPATKYTEYGVKYAYSYEKNTIKKEHKKNGHLIEHTVINGVDNNYLYEHSGAAILINDIGVWNNFQLDGVSRWAFRNNEILRRVLFADLEGWFITGDTYSDVDITLDDSCFVGCKNLEYVDLLYIVTDQKNFLSQFGSWTFDCDHLAPLTPKQIKIGKDVFENSPKVRLKMMPQQVAWFEADSTWAKYCDRFLPCVFHTDDDGVNDALEDLKYYNPSGYSPEKMSDYIDLSLVLGKKDGFYWLSNRFRGNTDIHSFADFKLFEHLGLSCIGSRWFLNCSNMNRINLPSTITCIQDEAFEGCTSLSAIELPAQIDTIRHLAFNKCTLLKTIIVHNTKPARFFGGTPFPKNEGMKIYVPDESLNDYLNNEEWKEYKDYIVGMSSYKVNKVITVTEPGQLAAKLGLTVGFYNHWLCGEQFRKLLGHIEPYDSLTVRGPINGLDLTVLRYLAGSDTYEFNGEKTDGRLRYLNLADADIRKSPTIVFKNRYAASIENVQIEEDDILPRFAFCGCTELETLILPKSLKKFEGYCFSRCENLKQLAVGGSNLTYEQGFVGKMISNPLEELVFYTDKTATCSDSDPWGADILSAYTKKKQIGDYMTLPYLTKRVHSFTAPFENDDITQLLFDKGEFFPSSYLMREEVEGLFQGNTDLTRFDEFYKFEHVMRLDKTFKDCSELHTIMLPRSVESIGAEAFDGCVSLDTIRVVCDSVPTLAADAFASLPADFRILVPKSSCKLYRTKWAQYADHINMDGNDYADDDIVEVTLTEPNTLAEKLGLTVTINRGNLVRGIHGDYSHVRRLKVNGPISGHDFDVLKYLAGYCPWTRTRNCAGQLEYIDLYDANIVKSTNTTGMKSGYKMYAEDVLIVNDNELPIQAFLKCYPLKTIILPRTCKKVWYRSLQECEGLETLVVGDDMEDFNWSALDDDASLTRMYILAKKKMEISTELALWRLLCNNYNPTFDAFYVRPSLYQDYLNDDAYTGKSWQRTNNVSKGEFDEDDSFCAFAKHAAATQDDLANVTDVRGWFDSHPGAKNLKALGYTQIDTLHKETIEPLKELAQIALPATLNSLPAGIFSTAKKLVSVDLLQSSGTALLNQVRTSGFTPLGIDTLQTVVFLPADYGENRGTNIVVYENDGLHTHHYQLADSLDYCVPYSFEADTVTFTRHMEKDKLYSLCLPYRPDMTGAFKLWQVDTRDGATIIFKEATDDFLPLKPYLVQPLTDGVTMQSCTKQTIPTSGGTTVGKTENFYNYTAFRSTLQAIDEQETSELLAYIVDETVTPMDNDFCSTGTWSEAEKIAPFTAFLLPGGKGSFLLKLQDSGELVIYDRADNQTAIGRYSDKTVRTATLQGRTLLKDGSWNTLCLPFGLSSLTGTPLEGAMVKTLVSSSFNKSDGTLTLNFSDDLDAVEAGKAYIVRWENTEYITEETASTADTEGIVFSDVTIDNNPQQTTAHDIVFVGSFSPFSLKADDRTILYMGAENKLYYPDADMTIGSCRAHFKLNGLTAGDLPANGVKAILLNFGDGATGIMTTDFANDTNGNDSWFTIDGRRLSGQPAQPGIYIHNGQKVMLK